MTSGRTFFRKGRREKGGAQKREKEGAGRVRETAKSGTGGAQEKGKNIKKAPPEEAGRRTFIEFVF